MELDYSSVCSRDDEKEERCWKCTHFVFPIGCMLGEKVPKEDDQTGISLKKE